MTSRMTEASPSDHPTTMDLIITIILIMTGRGLIMRYLHVKAPRVLAQMRRALVLFSTGIVDIRQAARAHRFICTT